MPTKIEKRLYEACKNVVRKCQAGFKELNMEGPDILVMGIVWYNAYMDCKEAIDFVDKEWNERS